MREKLHSSTVFLSCWLIYFLLQLVTKPVTIRTCSSVTKIFTVARPCKFQLAKAAPTTLAPHTGQRLALRDWCRVRGSGLVLPRRTQAIFYHHHYIAGLEKPGSLNASWLSSPDGLCSIYLLTHTCAHACAHTYTHSQEHAGPHFPWASCVPQCGTKIKGKMYQIC